MEVYLLIFDDVQVQKICEFILPWLASKSFGGRPTKTSFKYFQKNLWNPILKTIHNINNRNNLTEEEKEFLNLVVYDKDIFRVLNYYSKAHKYVCETQEYQSWSSSTEGLQNVPGIRGSNNLLLIGKADLGIDIFGLLRFLIKNKYIHDNKTRDSLIRIISYEKENEIAYKTSFDKIERIIVVNGDDLLDYDNKIVREIPRELWGRNNFD